MNHLEKQYDGVIIILFLMMLSYLLSLFTPFSGNKVMPSYCNQGHFDIVVGISGKNIDGGIYFLPPKTRLGEFLHNLKIQESASFDKELPNIPLKNAQNIFLLKGNKINITEMNAAQKLILDIPININEMSIQELTLIPGIGLKRAEQIIQLREKRGGIKAVEDLMMIKGIKEKTLEKIKGYFCTGNDCRK
jgi:competence protein ComEA